MVRAEDTRFEQTSSGETSAITHDGRDSSCPHWASNPTEASREARSPFDRVARMASNHLRQRQLLCSTGHLVADGPTVSHSMITEFLAREPRSPGGIEQVLPTS